jgi:hypothetical protein
VTVFIGWIFTGVAPFLVFGTREILLAWTFLMFFPITFTVEEYRKGESNKLFNFWALAVAILMIENFYAPLSLQAASFFTAWFLLGAGGFYYTSEKLPPPSEKTYRYAALLNLLAAPLHIFLLYTTPFIAAAVQGGPMLYDWFTVHRGGEIPFLKS